MKTTNQVEIKLKDGTVFPIGSSCDVAFPLGEGKESGNGRIAVITIGTCAFKVRCASLPRYFKTFKAPSIKTMERWMNDGIAETMTGDNTEPDGYGPDGAPSWLLALGLI